MKQSGKEKKLCRKRLTTCLPAVGAAGGYAPGGRRVEKTRVAAYIFEKDGWEAK